MLDRLGTHLRELELASEDAGSNLFLTMDDVEYTFTQVHSDVEAFARGLRGLGLVPGDRVLIMLPNCIEAVWAWLGSERLGLIDVPVTEESAGASLRHVVGEAEPRAVVGTAELLRRVAAENGSGNLEHALVVGEPGESPFADTVTYQTVQDLLAHTADDALPPVPAPSMTATVMFSSGTTGPPKGVMMSHGYYRHAMHAYDTVFPLARGQRLYCTQPLCHVDPRMTLVQSLAARASMVLKRRFSASQYWVDVETYDVDGFVFIGAMLHLLAKQPEGPERGARRRVGMGSAIPPSIHASFSERFNADIFEGYGMTEIYTVFCQYPGEYEAGEVGRELPGIEVQIVDQGDLPVSVGITGQLLVRSQDPHALMQGYWRRPEATVEAWQGLWFHTGDLVRRLPNGRVEYIGRLKDSIRRRGENVSAWQVESAANQHPAVLESAAIGVPADVGDEDIALYVVTTPEKTIDPSELRAALSKDLPRFALPRFIDVVAALPKTPSERVAKATLRQQGLSSQVHDFEAAARA